MVKREGGFTLIEIVLVLAIAGLIMTIVFIGVSGAQKSRRDTQRKNDMGRVAALFENYASNNMGRYPATADQWQTFWDQYPATANLKSPSQDYGYSKGSFKAGTEPDNPGRDVINYSSANTSYKACMGMEQGDAYCISNK